MAELLFWPALLGYGEAVFAYANVRTTRAATWGVRLGWLAQTALLIVQVAGTEGFPWSNWAGTLNLFVWFLVGTYLIWGCRPRFRLLGLTVMPLAFALFAVARIGGGTNAKVSSHYGDLFLVLHVGMLTAAFAGFTLAAGLAALYLWQEHRLKGRAADILRMRLPPLASLEFLAWRTILISMPLLTLGLTIGVVRQHREGGSFSQREILTLLAWVVYGGFLASRPTGRRAACLALGGFALVVVARIALAGSHFT
jgi:ABC-type uncharacterized transport system permease subunit